VAKASITDAKEGVRLLEPRRFGDARGWFTEVYSEERFRDAGIDVRFVQDNHSFSAPRFTLRGLHYQEEPVAQHKLIRCVRGRIFDVAVDLRSGSPGYGDWTAVELSAENGRQLFVPVGFAHGFLTLEPDCEVMYKVSAPYAPDSEGGVAWDDPELAIEWPLPAGVRPVLSGKDEVLPRMTGLLPPFTWSGEAAAFPTAAA
jgi:dTDP-4-dehydrorhamnose 3,5-epimerase